MSTKYQNKREKRERKREIYKITKTFNITINKRNTKNTKVYSILHMQDHKIQQRISQTKKKKLGSKN